MHHVQQGSSSHSACWPHLGMVVIQLHLLLELAPAKLVPEVLPGVPAYTGLQCNFVTPAGHVSFSSYSSLSAELCGESRMAAAILCKAVWCSSCRSSHTVAHQRGHSRCSLSHLVTGSLVACNINNHALLLLLL